MQNKLLPCPFCGGEAHLTEFIGLDKKMNYYVECGSVVCGVYPETTLFDTQEEAIEQWNTRKPMERIVEQLEDKKWNIHDWRDKWRNEIIDECIEVVKGGVDNAE